MLTHNLGYLRIGINRDLKKVVESYWKGDISKSKLVESTEALRVMHWTKQKEAGIDRVPSNDFSLYDQVLVTANSNAMIWQSISVSSLPALLLPATAGCKATAPAG